MSKLGVWFLKVWLFIQWVPRTYWDAFYYLRPRILELGGAAWAIGWGFWVGNPWWNVFPSSPTFSAMGMAAPEWVWGTTVLLAGVGELIALYNNNMVWRYRISVFSFLLWAFVTILFLRGNPFSTATITYGMMWVVSAIVVVKLWWRNKMGIDD